MSNPRVRTLPNWEGDVYLWIEQESSIMFKACDADSRDPVELTADDARQLARMLIDAADELDKM